MSLADLYNYVVVPLGIVAGLLSLAYLVLAAMEFFGLRPLPRIVGRLAGWSADARRRRKSLGQKEVADPPRQPIDPELESEAEKFFREEFGPDSLHKYAHDDKYRARLEDLLRRVVKGGRDAQSKKNPPTQADR